MQLRLGANTIDELNNANGMLVFFNCPKDTPEIRQNLQGLILCLSRARFYTATQEKQVSYSETAKALSGIEVYFMSDKLLNRGVNSLVEIEFTLKHLLTKFTDETEIKFFIDKPSEPSLDDNDEWVMTDNHSITSQGKSVLQVGSLLENSSITEVLKIAMLDDGTIQLPDVNPFNLESKIDGIRTDINLSQLHFTGEFTSLINWFASAFRESPYSPIAFLNNPFSTQTIYQMILESLNSVEKSYTSITIPFYGTISVPKWLKTDSFLADINQNIATSFNENYDSNTRLATNSYFRYFYTFLYSDWKLFQSVVENIKDCICEARGYIGTISQALTELKTTLYNGLTTFEGTPLLGATNEQLGAINGSIQGLQLSPTVNNDINVSPTPITINNCCDDLVSATQQIANEIANGNTSNNTANDNIKDLINELTGNNSNTSKTLEDLINEIKKLVDTSTDNGATITDNNDGTYSVKPNLPDYGDVVSGDGTTTVPLKKLQPTKIIRSNRHNSKCGFVFKTLTDIGEAIDTLADLIQIWLPLVSTIGTTSLATIIVGSESVIEVPLTGGLSLAKIPAEIAIVKAVLDTSLIADLALLKTAKLLIDDYANEIACSEVLQNVGKSAILTFVNTAIGGTNPFASIIMTVANTVYDYSGASEDTVSIINMDSYAQYCPCPLNGLFNGHYWNNITGTNERHFYLECDGTTLWGTHTSKDLFGTVFEMEIINGLVDVNNELVANGTLHVTNQSGYPDSSLAIATNVSGSELYHSQQTYIKVG